jgi:hypothetical protein
MHDELDMLKVVRNNGKIGKKKSMIFSSLID